MLIEPYLNQYIDLITLQLGENVYDISTYEDDFIYLIEYIMKKCPHAQIVIIGDFWENNENELIKEEVVQQTGMWLVDLNMIQGKEKYQCGIGTIVFDENGIGHIIEHEGVAMHPGDIGMEYIAKKILAIVE